MGVTAAYLPPAPGQQREPFEWTPELSRRAPRVRRLRGDPPARRGWLAEIVERDCDMAAHRPRPDLDPGVRLRNEVVLNQVLFRCRRGRALTRDVIARVQADGTAWVGGTTFHDDGSRSASRSRTGTPGTMTRTARSRPSVRRSTGRERRGAARATGLDKPRRLPKEPPRCCPGEGVRRNGHFCHASRASITSAAPTTLTLPTHDLDAGAAWLTEQHRYPTPARVVFQGFWHTRRCKFLNLHRVTPSRATSSRRVCRSVLVDGHRRHRHRIVRQVLVVARRRDDLVDDVETLGDLAEEGVVLRQLAGQVVGADEELASRWCSDRRWPSPASRAE